MTDVRVIIAGGGTGGHLYPGIAIAEEITRRPGGEVLFVGTARGLETRLVPAAGFPLELLEVSGLKRVGLSAMARGLLRLPKALLASRKLLRRFRPDLVIGVGGYASGPVVLTAALLGYPTAIQEQNSHPGFTNRVLGRFVRRVFVAFEGASRFFARKKIVLCGNPVRRRFLEAVRAGGTSAGAAAGASSPTRDATAGAETAGAATPGAPTLLVVGGSQGARAVSDLVIGAAEILAGAGTGAGGVATAGGTDAVASSLPRIVHQTGPTDEARVRARYAELGLAERVDVRAYIEDMVTAVAGAALVVGRAGALTLAELAVMGRPAILIPLPTAADDHQTKNAAELAAAGAAVVLDQRVTTPAALAELVRELMADPARRARMGDAMAALGRPGAARQIVDDLETLAGAR